MRLIPIHDNEYEDEPPLMPEAAEIAVRTLAASLGIAVAEDAVVLYRPRVVFGAHPLARLYDGGTAETWVVDEWALERALDAVSDAELEKFGVRREPSFEREAARLIRRRLAHLSPDEMREILALLPRLHELAFAFDVPEGFTGEH